MIYLARNAVLFSPHIVVVRIIQLRPKEIGIHRPSIVFSVDSGLVKNMNQRHRYIDWTLLDFLWISIVPNFLILFVHIPVRLKFGSLPTTHFDKTI